MCPLNKKLTKSDQRIFAGVLGGIADYFDWNPSWVRIGYVVLSVFTGGIGGLPVYLAAALIIPDR
ncbi:PspC domain-containing protein [Secundilactobacillus collinoides]|uniref:PspC domain-containing protein n=1 Tax=Secundilactobacillus collinoides TaxID=33960 RepID=UPI001F181498|nr:PspC domain-containing protein [Secundilactobacillus collinoides]